MFKDEQVKLLKRLVRNRSLTLVETTYFTTSVITRIVKGEQVIDEFSDWVTYYGLETFNLDGGENDFRKRVKITPKTLLHNKMWVGDDLLKVAARPATEFYGYTSGILEPALERFYFGDPNLAMMFKLTFA